ncbi:RluA family pseudouridine synthase [Spiroplasma endosymbiont of Crioceris asparagi]|uniref:RluA family pseudouridine synthase n=1 Tax=Spiroplasma endosymbiont of Crioceris asparagi TaxID=3066286 RepID=UPI0030D47228
MTQEISLLFVGEPMRLDKYLVETLKSEFDFSRTIIQKMIDNNQILVNGILKPANYKLSQDDVIQINIEEPTDSSILPKDIKFEVVYEDKDIIVVDKPNDLTVHPAPENYENTLVNGLLFKIKDLSSIGGEKRPGIVHRLDKMTTGLMVVAKNDNSHKILSEAFKNREVKKKYLALVNGVIKENKGRIVAPIGRSSSDRKKMEVTSKNSKEAITLFEVVGRGEDCTLVECEILTGRTHQIRVHFKYINHPIIGDHVYGYEKDKNYSFGQYLHAYYLEFQHPTKNKKIIFSSNLPKSFTILLNEKGIKWKN